MDNRLPEPEKPPFAWLDMLTFRCRALVLAGLMTAIGSVIMALALPRIDFHADEAIYLSEVPVNTRGCYKNYVNKRNSTGLLFNAAYLSIGLGSPSPLSARWTSMLFGCLLIFSATRVVQLLIPSRATLLAILIPISIVVSYQGIFTILRVRPEISWIAVTSLACWCLAELRQRESLLFRGLLLISLVVLPMNHLLSLFSAFFLSLYIMLFGRVRLGTVFCSIAVGGLGLGMILNQAIRSWIAQGEFRLLPALSGATGGERPEIDDFLRDVFWRGPQFLNDVAANENLWTQIIPWEMDVALSHCLVATVIWLIALPLPLIMRSWESRFVASIPLVTLVLFYASGYFNPTYSPILTLYGVIVYGFVVVDPYSWQGKRLVAGLILAVSIANGGSFLATRVFNHGPASFFEVESRLRTQIAELPPDTEIAVAERFRSVVGDRRSTHILFKDKLPENVKIVVLDNYDFEMYRFVRDYDDRRREISNFIRRAVRLDEATHPVYSGDLIFPQTSQNTPLVAFQGSWFFRNSVDYTVSVFESTATPEHVARDHRNNRDRR